MRYISLFSGIGGLESEHAPPLLCCELDPACTRVLQDRFGGVEVHPDVTTLHPPSADVVTGGWPCQDISVAGLRRGLAGERSGLFFEMLRVALASRAHTVVAENVPNLLTISGGAAFDLVLQALHQSGYVFVAWRTLDAREFGLPHERRRVFIVASKYREIAMGLHRTLPETKRHAEPTDVPGCAGFYWTAGLQSLCYSVGFVPTLKVGSALSIPSPPALHFGDVVRKATASECLRLQGFAPAEFAGVTPKDVFRMTGNAVARPVGAFVLGSVGAAHAVDAKPAGFGYTARSGYFDGSTKFVVHHEAGPLAKNLSEFINLDDRTQLSARASAGLVERLVRSGKRCPADLLELLVRNAGIDMPRRHASGPGREAPGTADGREPGDSYSLFG